MPDSGDLSPGEPHTLSHTLTTQPAHHEQVGSSLKNGEARAKKCTALPFPVVSVLHMHMPTPCWMLCWSLLHTVSWPKERKENRDREHGICFMGDTLYIKSVTQSISFCLITI